MNVAEPNSLVTPRIAVIGGGIAGLAAAHRIVELLPHAELALFEASSRLGGVLDTVHIDGFLIERSADNFLTKQPQAVELCRRLGIEDDLIPTEETRRRAFVVRAGRLLPIPEGFHLMSPRKLWPILKSPLLSPAGKLRLLAEPWIPRRRSFDSQPSTLDVPDESIASFARRRLGRETFERLVQPLVAGIYTADPEKLSMAATMPEFLELERTHGSLLRAVFASARRVREQQEGPPETASGARYSLFTAPKHGMASLINALADRLDRSAIHVTLPVDTVRQVDGAKWLLNFGFRIADCGLANDSSNPQSAIHNPQSPSPSPRSFDALVLAVPSHAAARLLESHDASLSAELAAIEYAGCAVVSLGFDRRQIAHPLDGFGFVVPQIEQRRIIAASFASQKFPGRAPQDAVLIRAFVGGALQPELLDRPDSDLRQLVCDELRELLQITGEPVLTDIARWPRSMPQYHVGHLDRVARIEQLVDRHATLALAGNAYRGVGIPQCIASGEAAAERIAREFSR